MLKALVAVAAVTVSKAEQEMAHSEVWVEPKRFTQLIDRLRRISRQEVNVAQREMTPRVVAVSGYRAARGFASGGHGLLRREPSHVRSAHVGEGEETMGPR